MSLEHEDLLCRTTVNLVGAKLGSRVYVDHELEWTRLFIDRGYLVPINDDGTDASPASSQPSGDAADPDPDSVPPRDEEEAPAASEGFGIYEN